MIEEEQNGQLNSEMYGKSKASPYESEIHPSHKPCRVRTLCISPLRGSLW
ncbi:MAG: hypothetical protein IJJ01_08995 [Firmicutes bacterium]|nr:hypothetical protein [Bacillota bacterium]